MKTTKRITTGAVGIALAALALTGCVVETVPHGAENPQPPATSAPPEPEAPTEEAENEGTENGSRDEKSETTADLGVEDGQTQYLRAIQAFSPELEWWVVDEAAGEVTYSLVNCLGQPQSEGVATLEPSGGDTYHATWIGKSPIENVAAEQLRLVITENTLTNFADVASSRTDVESGNFSRMCTDAGEAAAEFVF